jgi:hypothetical protein
MIIPKIQILNKGEKMEWIIFIMIALIIYAFNDLLSIWLILRQQRKKLMKIWLTNIMSKAIGFFLIGLVFFLFTLFPKTGSITYGIALFFIYLILWGIWNVIIEIAILRVMLRSNWIKTFAVAILGNIMYILIVLIIISIHPGH